MSLPPPGWQDDVPAEPKQSGGLGLPHPQKSNHQEKAEPGFSARGRCLGHKEPSGAGKVLNPDGVPVTEADTWAIMQSLHIQPPRISYSEQSKQCFQLFENCHLLSPHCVLKWQTRQCLMPLRQLTANRQLQAASS